MSLPATHRVNFNRVVPEEITEIHKGLKLYFDIDGNKGPAGSLPIFRAAFADFYFRPRGAKSRILKLNDFFVEIRKNLFTDPIKLNSHLQSLDIYNSEELSFCSKAIHTYHNETPIYDSHVCDYIEKYYSGYIVSTGIIKDKYDHLCDWYKFFKTTSDYPKWTKWYDANISLPKGKTVSDIKKIDSILYQLTYASTKNLFRFAEKHANATYPEKLVGLSKEEKRNLVKNEPSTKKYIEDFLDCIYTSNALTNEEAKVLIMSEGIAVKKVKKPEIAKSLDTTETNIDKLLTDAKNKLINNGFIL